jgi:hypothetical protein
MLSKHKITVCHTVVYHQKKPFLQQLLLMIAALQNNELNMCSNYLTKLQIKLLHKRCNFFILYDSNC